MRIFNYNPGILNLNKYYQDIESADQVDGIFVNILLDNNLDLQVFLPDLNQKINLVEFLDMFRTSKKTIILNLLLGYELLSDQNALSITNYNNIFVQKIVQLLNNYNNNFYLCSINTPTLYFLKINPLPYKIGTIITRADLGFIDVDFYIFSEYFINIEFITSLISRNKEIMIFPDASGIIRDLPNNIKSTVDYIIQNPTS